MTEPIDLFGSPTGPDQFSLFGPGEDRLQRPVQDFNPKPEDVRRRLHKVLEKARRARVMPWPEREVRMWQTVFPNMTNWLPQDEADQLRFAFAKEIEHLKAA